MYFLRARCSRTAIGVLNAIDDSHLSDGARIGATLRIEECAVAVQALSYSADFVSPTNHSRSQYDEHVVFFPIHPYPTSVPTVFLCSWFERICSSTAACPTRTIRESPGNGIATGNDTRDTLLKFNPDGSPRPFAGNTVICHLPQQTDFAMPWWRSDMHWVPVPFTRKSRGLPDDSYHATILGGLNDQDRERYGWPSDVPINTPIAECNRVLTERFARFRMNAELPLRFRLDKEKTLSQQRPAGYNSRLPTGTRN